MENEEPAEVYNLNFMKSQNQTSRSPENKLQEVYISNPNNTNLSDTEMNDNKSNHIISVDEKRFDSDNRSEDCQASQRSITKERQSTVQRVPLQNTKSRPPIKTATIKKGSKKP